MRVARAARLFSLARPIKFLICGVVVVVAVPVVEITSTITPELYDTKSYYQLIASITKCEKLSKSTVEEKHLKSKENISE